ncbi:MAG: (Fe-S)-binding protein [bacterium]
MTKDLLKQFEEEIKKCILCGACQSVCPVYAETLDEVQVARGRMALLNAVLSGELELTDHLNDIVSSCIGCKACSAQCPAGSSADLANLAAKNVLGREKGLPFYEKFISRQIFSNSGALTASAHLLDIMGRRLYTPLSRIRPIHPLLPYMRNGTARRIPQTAGKLFRKRHHANRLSSKPRGRVVLFYGCAVDLFFPHWGESAIRILNQAGFEVIVPKEMTCCGAPMLFMGDAETARKSMETNLAAIGDAGPDAVVTLCATCGSMLRELYPKFLQNKDADPLSGKVVDLQEFLISRNLLNDVMFTEEIRSPLRVTYHDPCHLNRGMGVREAPRTILKNLPGVEFIEMRDADRCCGGGGLFSMSHYDLSLKIGRHKAERIRETGADVVATACPSCIIHLTDLLERAGLKIRVMHVCELLDLALRIPDPGLAALSHSSNKGSSK